MLSKEQVIAIAWNMGVQFLNVNGVAMNLRTGDIDERKDKPIFSGWV